MYHVSKLGIMGIRCFSHTDAESVRFTKPLTLIVGANGTGKTTIVESLRMALTGDVPLNSNKGHTFLHDPRMENLSEIKGQIRLILEHKDGDKKIGIVRNLQLSMRKDKKDLSFKQLDSVLQVKDSSGRVISTSNKCFDVNASILGLLKVPKAVLDSVILCHQDDSLWPLSDSTALKKRFDELLGFNRYVRTLEVITTLKKKLVKVVATKKHDLALLQKDDSQRAAVTAKLSNYASTLESIAATVNDLSANRKIAKERVDAIDIVLKSQAGRQEKVDHIMQKLGSQILEDPLPDIIASHANFEIEHNKDQQEAENLTKEIACLEKQIDSLLTEKAEFADRHEEFIKMTTRRDCLKDEFFQLWFRINPDSSANPDRNQLDAMIQNAQRHTEASANLKQLRELVDAKNQIVITHRAKCSEIDCKLTELRHFSNLNDQRILEAKNKLQKIQGEAAQIRSDVSNRLKSLNHQGEDKNVSLENFVATAIQICEARLERVLEATKRAEFKKKELDLRQKLESARQKLKVQSSSSQTIINKLERNRVELKLIEWGESVGKIKTAGKGSKEKSIEDIYSEHRMALDAQTLYTNFKDYANRKRKCALCFRPFTEDTQFEQHMKALNVKLTDSIQPKVESTTKALSKVSSQSDLSASVCARAQQRPKQEILGEIDAFQADLEIWKKIEELENSVELLRNLYDREDDENLDVKNIAAESSRKRQRRSSASEEKLDSLSLAQLETEKSCAERNIAELRPMLVSAGLIEAQLAELQKTADSGSNPAREVEHNLARALDASKEKLRESETEFSRVNNQLMAAEAEVRQKLQEISAGCNSLKRYLDDIDGLEVSLSEHQNMTSRGEIQFDSIDRLSALQQGLADDRDCLKVVQKKISVRASMIDTLKQNIELKKLGEMDPKEFKKKELELTEIRTTYDRLTAEVNRLQGERSTYERLCGELRVDLRKYKDLDEQLSRVSCEVFVNQAMAEDLGKYCNALRQSMLVYHNTKLKEINVIAKDLWRSVYAGSDIEYIFLMTERAVVGRAAEDLSYTYKLCMMKNDIVTEMRGRSSAGQKVLASVILRLALIEVLGKRCGILALDEPTTNLDDFNVDSLAVAIGRLTHQRRMENFQMIVITHDEDFINKLRQNSTSSCSKLVRDFNTGYTKCINEKAS